MNNKEVQSVGIVVIKGDKVLLVESGSNSSHLNGSHGLPAGKVDPGETHIQAAIRELKEETGLDTEEKSLIPLKVFEATIQQKQGLVNFIWHTFLCTLYTGDLRSTEETTPKWVPISELPNIPNLLPNVEAAVALGVQIKG